MALPMALMVMLVLAILIGAIVVFSTGSARNASYSNGSEHAHTLAEAGAHSALAILNANYPDYSNPFPGNRCLLRPQVGTSYGGTTVTAANMTSWGCTSTAAFTTAFDGGSCTAPITNCVTWSGALFDVTGKPWPSEWVIVARGEVPNPTGPGSPTIPRKVTLRVPVVIPPAGPIGGDDALNWLYAGEDVTFSNAVLIGSPVYSGGNLTLSNSAAVCGFAGNVVVGGNQVTGEGNLTLSNTQDKIGLVPDGTGTNPSCPKAPGNATDPRIAQAHVFGTCTYKNQAPDPCLAWNATPTPGDWDADNVFVNKTSPASDTYDKNTVGWVRVPVLNPTVLQQHYDVASPGPRRGCESTSPNGAPPFSFDSNGVLDVSTGGSTPSQPVNLTPATSYTCKNQYGELSWDVTAKTLTISGGIYIDGSATIDTSNRIYKYSGVGAIYLTGTFAMKNSNICAISAVTSSGCDFTYNVWKPDENALIIIAYGYGAHSANESQSNNVQHCDSITLTGAQFQGALEGKHNISELTTSQSQGPLVAVGPASGETPLASPTCTNTELRDGSVSSNQTNLLTFPVVHFSSLFSPTAPLIPSTLLSPQEVSG
jgi:hypothetical protein